MSRNKQNKVETPEPPKAAEPGTQTTYAVPGEVAVALSTGRTQFIEGLVKRVRAGHLIEPVQVIGMLELIRDWTSAKYADDRRNVIARESLAALTTNLRELRDHAALILLTATEAKRAAGRHGSGPIGPEDEVD